MRSHGGRAASRSRIALRFERRPGPADDCPEKGGPGPHESGDASVNTDNSRRHSLNWKALLVTSAVPWRRVLVGLGVWLRVTESRPASQEPPWPRPEQAPDRAGVRSRRRRATSTTSSARAADDVRAARTRSLGSCPKRLAAATQSASKKPARWNDRLLRLDPNGPGRQTTRRRSGGALPPLQRRPARDSPLAREAPDMVTSAVRHRSAEAIAREMIRNDPSDG